MERVLVCLTCSTRGHEVTFPSFKRQVLDELNADLALALAIDPRYDHSNPYWQRARYRWTIPDSHDYGEAFDSAQRWLRERDNVVAPDWRSILRIKGIWLSGVRPGPPAGQRSVVALALCCRSLVLRHLQQDGLLDRYDRFVISRSDFMWLSPHPPLSILDRHRIWIPQGEDYGGLNDRHMVVSRDDVVNGLNLIEAILLQPLELYEQMKQNDEWNSETFLLHHFTRKGLVHRVSRFPAVMYLARDKRDHTPTWSRGTYDAALGHFIKYDTEFDSARAFATIISSRADWEGGAWKQFDPATVTPRPMSMQSRILTALDTLSWALRRPGRLVRLWRFVLRIVRPTGTTE